MGSTDEPIAPKHLNPFDCQIRYSPGKGRGVFATKPIPARTVIEISPVLLFTKEEYEEHGRHTVLDHYTFKWRDGRMALALGLGSLFNHCESPNVSFVLDSSTDSIRYTTSRAIQAAEELFIFYGHNLWFQASEGSSSTARPPSPEVNDGWGGLSAISDADDLNPFRNGAPSDILTEDELPFTRLKLIDDTEEDLAENVRTMQVWAIDIKQPQDITTMLKWVKSQGLDTPDLAHLKRVKKQPLLSTIVLSSTANSTEPPAVPEHIDLSAPYVVTVPESAALTQVAMYLKSAIWPTVFAPRRKHELEDWTRGKAAWAYDAMMTAREAAREAGQRGELPIAAHVPPSFEDSADEEAPVFTAHDTRISTSHPLRHAAQNVIRKIADYLAQAASTSNTTAAEQNGKNYLLTSQTLFITHEPCIMCSMALLHSRVKEVFYMTSMEKTGGCGGLSCLSKLKGVNHRFGVATWKDGCNTKGLGIDPNLDV